MPELHEFILPPEIALDDRALHEACKNAAKNAPFEILRRSLDARKKPAQYLIRIAIGSSTEPITPILGFALKNVSCSPEVHIVGAGSAGLFAAFELVSLGYKPVLLERGKNVRDRRRDLAAIHKELKVNPNSNYCFGEGGAGTYSDGKLYTRSKKRGDIRQVLNTFIQHGAIPNIAYDAHPHIGTNKLPQIIESMRETLISCGAEFHFDSRVTQIHLQFDRVVSVEINHQNTHSVQALLLATGHSARDIYRMLKHAKIPIAAKPFALGVRIEHPQTLIDEIQYKLPHRGILPPASYSLVEQIHGRGVFSFCMCPGGIICAAATAPGEVVVNGWSPSKRNGWFSNSGMVVSLDLPDYATFSAEQELAGMAFQEQVEKAAFSATGSIQAPAQRMEDFIQSKTSSTLPSCSYHPGIQSASLQSILPDFISNALKEGFKAFGNIMKGYRTNEAVLVGVESRTSSAVRIPRDRERYFHPQVNNLFPCGEGAGYAGGIMSAALDGMNSARAVKQYIEKNIH